MSKIIRLKKGIFDQTHPAIPEEQTINYTSQTHPAIPEEQTINYTSQRLTGWLHQIRAFLPCLQ